MPSDAFCSLRFYPIAQLCVCVCVSQGSLRDGKISTESRVRQLLQRARHDQGTHPIIHFYQSEEEKEDEDGDK